MHRHHFLVILALTTTRYLAVKRGHHEAVEVLLNFKADASSTDVNHLTPLSIAAQLGNAEMCDLLIRLTKEQTQQADATNGAGAGTSKRGGDNSSSNNNSGGGGGGGAGGAGGPGGQLFRHSSSNAGRLIRRGATGRGKLSWTMGATVLTCDRWGLSPLHRAACLNHVEVGEGTCGAWLAGCLFVCLVG